MDFANFPKIELHLHLDCSLSYEVVGKLRPGTTLREYRSSFTAPARCTNLAEYIACASAAIDLMQSPEALRLVTLDLFEQLQADQVLYAEIRFAPLQHLSGGLSPKEVVQIVEEATVEGIRKTGVEAGVILCTLRHFSETQSMETVQLVEAFSGTHIVGFDIAADEAGFPVDAHISAFRYAGEKGLFCTAHAGEARGADSVWETLEHFGPSRIGHGVRSIEDPDLIAYLKTHGIHLEVCPTSNIQTNMYEDIASHPIDRLYQSGVSMSINTDGRSLSDTNLGEEYNRVFEAFNWEQAQFLKCNLEAIRHAFISEEKKDMLRQKLLAGFAH